MHLFADSGSTKTDWKIQISAEKSIYFSTIGMNPFFISSNKIITELADNFPKDIDENKIKTVDFYGAGCSSYEKSEIIITALNSFFSKSVVSVQSDLLGAAAALFNNEEGIVAILGTGSNTCMYNGKKITKNVSSLGYILGDEGSGAYIGRKVLQAFLNNELDENLRQKFIEKYNLNTQQILDKVYKQPFPNKFLATFTQFISENISSQYLIDILVESFSDLFEKHITKYPNYKTTKIRCVGSIAYHFQDILQYVAKKYESNIDLIIQAPIKSLGVKH